MGLNDVGDDAMLPLHSHPRHKGSHTSGMCTAKLKGSSGEQGTVWSWVLRHCGHLGGDLLQRLPVLLRRLLVLRLATRTLVEPRVGDALVIEGAGAYCSGMAAKNYNAFPECAEVLLRSDGSVEVIRRRQTLEQMLLNEM